MFILSFLSTVNYMKDDKKKDEQIRLIL